MDRRSGAGRPSKRAQVLDAATRVALRDGPGGVTIEAVVAETGLSRGGVLYHFPAKEALLRALVDRDVEVLRDTTGLDADASQRSAADRVRDYYTACAALPIERGRVALAVALAENPALLDSWAQVQRELDALDALDGDGDGDGGGGAGGVGDDVDMAALVARLTLDGLWFSDLIDPQRFTAAQRRRLVAAILPPAVDPAVGSAVGPAVGTAVETGE